MWVSPPVYIVINTICYKLSALIKSNQNIYIKTIVAKILEFGRFPLVYESLVSFILFSFLIISKRNLRGVTRLVTDAPVQ